jgi:GNAT superfamily N-acetyltransferase
MELRERKFDRDSDLAELLEVVRETRASGDARSFLHPGGLQWWLRRLVHDDFRVWQWFDHGTLAAFVIDDDGYVIVHTDLAHADQHLDLVGWAEGRLAELGRSSIVVSARDRDEELVAGLSRLGYEPSGTFSQELVHDLSTRRETVLPRGFSLGSLDAHLDGAFIDLHRDAWSTWGPPTYSREMHALVTRMPDFWRELTPIVTALDRTLAAYCIGWFDPRSRWVEIEPLGTRQAYRKRGLAHAIVTEITNRSRAAAATAVMVWGVNTNPDAVRLYTSCGFGSTGIVREYRKWLSDPRRASGWR